MTATRGDSKGSNRAEWHQRRVVEALEGLPWPGKGWSHKDDPRGSPASSSSGTAACSLPDRATAFYALVECVGVVDAARGGRGWPYL